MEQTSNNNAYRIVDPVMGDNGKLYPGFDSDFPAEMAKLCKDAFVIMPNLTEASFLLGIPYAGDNSTGKDYDKAYIESLLKKLYDLGCKNVVLTGVSFEPDKLGCACYDGNKIEYFFNQKLSAQMHGTGDVFASSFAGALCNGYSVIESSKLAADMVIESMKKTLDDKDHWYGVKFEKALPWLVNQFNK